MGKQAKITQIQKRITREQNGKPADAATVTLPQPALQRLQALDGQVSSARNAFQQFLDGVVMGLGIDTTTNTVAIGQDGTLTVTPKNKTKPPDAPVEEVVEEDVEDAESRE